jgi:hypothetical protein
MKYLIKNIQKRFSGLDPDMVKETSTNDLFGDSSDPIFLAAYDGGVRGKNGTFTAPINGLGVIGIVAGQKIPVGSGGVGGKNANSAGFTAPINGSGSSQGAGGIGNAAGPKNFSPNTVGSGGVGGKNANSAGFTAPINGSGSSQGAGGIGNAAGPKNFSPNTVGSGGVSGKNANSAGFTAPINGSGSSQGAGGIGNAAGPKNFSPNTVGSGGVSGKNVTSARFSAPINGFGVGQGAGSMGTTSANNVFLNRNGGDSDGDDGDELRQARLEIQGLKKREHMLSFKLEAVGISFAKFREEARINEKKMTVDLEARNKLISSLSMKPIGETRLTLDEICLVMQKHVIILKNI